MKEQASMTACMSAFGRAFHAENDPSPIFADTMARQLLTDEEYQAIGAHILSGMAFFAPEKLGTFADDAEALRHLVHTQIAPTPIARARFCEDSLKTAVRTGTEQYVILGAGLDTFALRDADFVREHPVFEVDHPLTQADKRARLERAGISVPKNLHFVAVDFARDDLRAALLAAGFDPRRKTFFSWLGVSYYLSAQAIESLLDTIAALSADGSSLVFDYADENLFSSEVRRVRNMLAMAAAAGEPMQSCFADGELAKLLERHGFLIYELMTAQEIQAQYFAGRADGFTAFEHINYVNAVYKKRD